MQVKILVVDDNHDIVELISDELKDYGHFITKAYSGNTAISLLNISSYDIIVSDLNMPDGNGMDVLEYSNTLTKKPIFIFFSATDHLIELKCINKGAWKFFQKPFQLKNILDEVEHLCTSTL